LFTSHYVKVPHSGLSSVTNGLSANVLYVICEYDSSPMKVNCGYAPATVKAIYDGRSKALTSLPYITQSNRIGIALSGSVADTWASSVKVGDTIEFRCDIAMDGDASKPILSLGSSMFMPLNAGEDGTSSIPSGYSMHTVYDPVTFPVVSQDGRKVWLVEIDGRQGWYSMGVRVYEVYRIGRKLGGWSLTRFDGGGSACMWVWNPSTSKGGLVNKPSDSKGERSCMSYILIRSK
ncbi:MAG: phosphodiester glycosidase family protein, partial [Bacteroidales bacterium]|nr:phosphodiester glycosidase family protein [Bacteroidales bacterium]